MKRKSRCVGLHSAPLVARRRTIAHVHVELAMTSGIDCGDGANNVPDVTGTLRLWRGNQILAERSPIEQVRWSRNNLVNTGGKVTARPAEKITSIDTSHTLKKVTPSSSGASGGISWSSNPPILTACKKRYVSGLDVTRL
jgi:hypothetical protein